MLKLKYLIKRGNNRKKINDIIDYDKSLIRETKNEYIITIITLGPHHLLDGDYVWLKNNDIEIKAESIWNSPTSFSITLSKIRELEVYKTIYTDNTCTLITETPYIFKKDYNIPFCLYGLEGEIIVDNCFFGKNEYGEPIKNHISIPRNVLLGNDFNAVFPYAYIGDTIIFDWESKEDISLEKIDIFTSTGFINISLPTLTTMETGLGITEERNELIKEEAKQKVYSPVIEHEKMMFEPYIIKDGWEQRANTLEIKLNFRDRQNENWSISPDKLWNAGAYLGLSDTIFELGFSDNDVKYQKSRLKQTFVRLLFYDSDDMLTQNLVGYSTIFLDTRQLFSSYTKNKIRAEKEKKEYTISDYNSNFIRLDSKIVVTDKYNTTSSSEGFYIYLYPSLLDENNAGTIYMKLEFNHAAYGKTIPMTCPMINGTPLSLTDENFPKSYLFQNENGNYETDIEKYFKDLLIPINIKYDTSKNKYIYYFPWIDTNDEKKITLTFTEPRINGIN